MFGELRSSGRVMTFIMLNVRRPGVRKPTELKMLLLKVECHLAFTFSLQFAFGSALSNFERNFWL